LIQNLFPFGITINLELFSGKTGTSALWLFKAHETVAQIAVLPEYVDFHPELTRESA